MLTTTRKETVIHSSLNHKLKTVSCVHPLRRGLEDSLADAPGQARNGTDRFAGVRVPQGQHGYCWRRRKRPGGAGSDSAGACFPGVKEEVSCGVNR